MSDIHNLFQETFLQESIPDFIRKVFLLLEVSFLGFRCSNTRISSAGLATGKLWLSRIQRGSQQKCCPKCLIRIRWGLLWDKYSFYDSVKYVWLQKNQEERRGKRALLQESPHGEGQHVSLPPFREELVFIKRKKRGYVEQTTLENKEARSIYQKYNIFVYGVLTKISKNLGASSQLTLPSELPKFMKDVL